jgi:predicted outer membrane repeat protein
MIICINGVNATDISNNSTIENQSPTIHIDSSYAVDIGFDTQSNPYDLVSSAVGDADGGETLYVSPTGDDNNSGTRDSPLATLAHAIEITETGNIVLLEGVHKASDLNTDKTLNIIGEANAIIDATKSNRILYIYEGGDVTLSNIEMINGYSSESGALLGNAGKLTLRNITLSDSISNKNGGAVYNVGTLIITDSIFRNNTANLGGAIYSGSSYKENLNIEILNTVFADNTALGNANNKGGGAIYAQASSGNFVVNNVTFKNNKAGKYGGGALYAMQLDNIRISDSKFINNSAEVNEYYGGGAIAVIGGNYQREGTTTITNTLFENNNADMSGGAIFLKGTTLDISNSVLVNSADANGIVIYSAPTVNSVNSKITANDNWWGSNDNPKKLITKVSTVTLNRWAILTVENDTEIVEGNNVNIAVSLTNYTTGSVNGTLSKPITIKRNVSLQTSFEEFDGVLENGKYNITYSIPTGLKLISATVDGQTVFLYVVESQASITLDNVCGKKGSKVNIIAQVVTSDSQIVSDGYINFYLDSKLIGRADVSNNNATLAYLIKEDEGIYNLTAEYISTSGAFTTSNATAMLNVSGLNNIVREDNFYEFFDENGIIRYGIIFDELIFEGEFNNVPQIITIDNPIKITGDDAVLNNIVFKVMADDVELNNMTFSANNDFMSNYGSIFLVTSYDVTLINNKINYTAPGTDSYVIYADETNGLKIINNEITFVNEFDEKNIFTNAIYLHDSNNVLMENNTMDITIPSVDIDYDFDNVFSEGVVLDTCDNAIVSGNNIHVKYNNAIGDFDTIRAVDIIKSDNLVLTNNTITADGHKYIYGVVIDGNDFNIYNNTINSFSDINYANGININGPASGILNSNTFSAIAPNASYPIYSSGYTGNVTALYVNNMVYADANDVYGIYVSGTNENLTYNDVLLIGNFTIGIASYSVNTVMVNNTVRSLASNIGKAWSLDIIPCVTSGITSIEGRCIVDGNKIETTGKYSVDIFDGEVTNNYLIANTTSGDKSVKSNSSILIENNIPLMKTANLTVNNISLKSGDEITFNVTLTDVDNNPLANYTVDLYINGGEYHAVTDINGIATFEVDSLPVGVYEMGFIIDNDDIAELITENALLNITLNDLNVNVTAVNIHEGEDLVINVTVPNNLEKDLEIRINNSTYLIKKSDSIVISGMSAGDYPISVYYPGDDYYREYNDEFNVTVNPKHKENVTISVILPEDNIVFYNDTSGRLIVQLKDADGNPIGGAKVRFTLGNLTKSMNTRDNGKAYINTKSLDVGDYVACVSFVGDDYYAPASATANVAVRAGTVLTAEDVIVVYQDTDGRLVVELKDAEGNPISGAKVKFTLGDLTKSMKTYSSGKAFIGTKSLDVGDYVACVSFVGDDYYAPASATVNVAVRAASVLTAEDVIVVYQDVDGRLVVELNDAEGNPIVDAKIKFALGNLTKSMFTYESGKAFIGTKSLDIGDYVATVTYAGDDYYAPVSVTAKVVVRVASVLTAEDVVVIYNDTSGRLIVQLKDADGNPISDAKVKITVGNLTKSMKTYSNGKAYINTKSLDIGDYVATVSYAGDDYYTGATITANVAVKKTATVLTAEDVVATCGDSSKLIAELKDTEGNPVSGVKVKFTLGNLTKSMYTYDSGKAYINTKSLAPGNYTAVISCLGDEDYAPSSVTANVVIKEE